MNIAKCQYYIQKYLKQKKTVENSIKIMDLCQTSAACHVERSQTYKYEKTNLCGDVKEHEIKLSMVLEEK